MRTNSFDAAYAQAAKEFILKNYRNKITTGDIASEIGISEKTLERAFKKTFDKGVYTYLVEIRMEKARELLESNRPLTIQQVADLVGYDHQSSFSTRFKKHFGVTPSNWEQNGILS
jgi:AraC-like DNA-binding protein